MLSANAPSTPAGTEKKKLRFLCLHGHRANATVMKFQLMGLQMAMPDAEMVIVNGSAVATEDPTEDILSFFGRENGPYYEWDYETSWDYMKAVVQEKGPFDGVIGFSQGAAIASALTARVLEECRTGEADAAHSLMWRGVVLVGGVEIPELESVQMQSVHVHGEQDPYAPRSRLLLQCYERGGEKLSFFTHKGGHAFPGPPKAPIYAGIARAIREMFE
ncbi:serine hydrolase FSH [Chytriomyces cf. hyalinus JEL632]|nr:serine hydrolase FSH [Chytriomyces cf. hyalinus JEL632]